MSRRNKKDRRLRKFHLTNVLSVCTGVMLGSKMSGSEKEAQKVFEELAEHVTGLRFGELPHQIIIKKAKEILEDSYPELKSIDTHELYLSIKDETGISADEKFKKWLDSCVEKGMKRVYRVKAGKNTKIF